MPQLKGSIPWNKGKGTSPEQKFWAKVVKTQNCWNWIGETRFGGYGYLYLGNHKYIRVHRFSYKLHKGKIPTGLLVCHSCDNRICVNPDHLWLGTHKDNAIDKMKKGRQVIPKGEKNWGCKIKWEEVKKMRELYKSELYFQYEIAKMFSISTSLTNMIINNKKRLTA